MDRNSNDELSGVELLKEMYTTKRYRPDTKSEILDRYTKKIADQKEVLANCDDCDKEKETVKLKFLKKELKAAKKASKDTVTEADVLTADSTLRAFLPEAVEDEDADIVDDALTINPILRTYQKLTQIDEEVRTIAKVAHKSLGEYLGK